MDEIIKILKEFRPDLDFTDGAALIDDGLLDSLDIVNIVSELESVYGVTISVEEVVPENFNYVGAIKALIDRLKDED